MKFEIRNAKKTVLAQQVLFLAIFLLPWQTRWIYSELLLQGEVWEYGKLSIYAVQILIVFSAILLGRPQYDFCRKRMIGLSTMFLGAGFLAVTTSLNFSLAIGAMLPLVVAVMLFMVLLDKRIDLEKAALALVLGLLLPSFLGWWQVSTGGSPAFSWLGLAAHRASELGQSVVELSQGQRVLRAYGPFSHPNIFGGYLALGILLAIGLLARLKEKRRQWIVGGALIIMLPTLVITFSRSAGLALVLGMGVWLGWMIVKKEKISKAVWRFGWPAMLLAFLCVLAYAPIILTRVQPQTRLEVKSVEERSNEYGLWAEVFQINKLTGVGPGNYTLALAKLDPSQPAWAYQPMHNSLLLAAAELGLFGLAILAWWWRHVLVGIKGAWSWAAALSFVPIIFLDHYLWSSWSGLAILALFLAFFARMENCRTQT